MNYQRHYGALIERAKARETLDGYSERHHIIPRCMGGDDEQSNLVALTAEEHFVAHQLLVKIHPGVVELVLAANMMTVSPTGKRNNNRRYAWIKRALSDATSKRFKGRSWTEEQNASRAKAVAEFWSDANNKERRSAKMRGRKWSAESRAARSAAMKGVVPKHINNKGRSVCEDVRARISATLKKRLTTEAERSLHDD